MKRRIGFWARLLSFRPQWPSRRTRAALGSPQARRKAGRLRSQAVRLEMQHLEPKLALSAAAGVKVTTIDAPSPGSYGTGDELVFQVGFSAPVQVTGTPIINLRIGRTTIPATFAGGSGTNTLSFKHVVAAGENDGNGIAVARAIGLPAAATIVDAAERPVSLALRRVGTKGVVVDTVAPTVASVTGPAAQVHAAGRTLSFTANFTERVFVTGEPTLPIQIGDVTRDAVWNGKGNGGRRLVFTTTLQPGDAAPAGVEIAGPIGMSGGTTLRDAAGNDVDPMAAAVFPKAVVDAVGPSGTAFGEPVINPKNRVVSLRVTFSEPVTVKGKPFIPVEIDGLQRRLAYASGSGSNVLLFRYRASKQVALTPETVVVPAQAISLPAGASIVDAMRNAAVSLARPTDVRLSASSLAENNPPSAPIGSFSTIDADGDRDRFTYALVAGEGGADNALFTIAEGHLVAAARFDYEARSQYSVRVRATDSGGFSTEKVFTIAITNVDEALTQGPVADGYLSGATVFADANANFVRDWNDLNADGIWNSGEGEIWTTTDSQGNFSFDFGDPAVTLRTIGGFDISTGLPFAGSLAAPGGSAIVNPLTTLVAATSIANPALTSAEAMSAVRAGLGLPADINLTTYDPIREQNVEVQKAAAAVANIIVAAAARGTDQAVVVANIAATVTQANGPVDLADAGFLRTVLTVGGTLPSDAAVANLAGDNRQIAAASSIDEITDAQKTSQAVQALIAENAPASTVVFQADATGLVVPTFGLDGEDASRFSIDASGAVRLLAPADFEAKNTYRFTVNAVDASGGSAAISVTLRVTDVNEAPTAVTLTNAVTSLPENTGTADRIKVAGIVVTDDALGTNTLALTGPDATRFEVDGTALFLKAGTALDARAKPSLTVTVNASDGTLPGSAPVTVAYALSISPVAPGAPAGVTATAGNAAATLAWSAPASDGGAAITDYAVEVSSDAGTTWTSVADGVSTATSATVTGLTNGTAYVFRVAAINSVGTGAVSANSAAVTPTAPVVEPATPPWVTRAGGKGTDWSHGVAAFADGSSVFVGGFADTVTFGDTELVGTDGSDTIIAKLDAAGGFVWATQATSTSALYTKGIATFADGSALVAGDFGGTATFGEHVLTTEVRSGFIAKLDENGDFVWATQATTRSILSAAEVATFADGSSIVTGSFSGTATFGDQQLTSGAGLFDDNVFIAKLDADGTFLWATLVAGSESGSASGLATLADGSVIVTGQFSGTAAFGSTSLTSQAGFVDGFIAKLDEDGSFVWATRAGGPAYETVSAVATTPDGAVIVAGEFGGTAMFGETALTVSGGEWDTDVFIAKLRADGTFAWAASAGGGDYETAYGIAALADGSAVVVGEYYAPATFGETTLPSEEGDAFVAKVDADGAFVWATRIGGAGFDSGAAIAALTDGSMIATGVFSGTVAFGGTTLASDGDSVDLFVAKLDRNGSLPRALPGSPTDLTATVGVGEVALSWQAGAANGTAISDYAIELSSDAGASWTTFSDGVSTATSATLTGLTIGSSYLVRVSAISAEGTGPASEPLEVLVAVLPAVPSGLSATAGDRGAILSWTAGASGGTPITDFVIEYSSDGGGTWSTFARPASAGTSARVTGLANGTAYVFRVAAINAVGTGPASETSAAVTPAPAAWATNAGGTGDDSGFAVSATLPDGSALVTGTFAGSATFGTTTLTSAGADDVFVARLDANGSFVWAVRAGGTGADSGHGIAALADGSIVVAGTFAGTATFGETTLVSAGASDAFVARLDADGSFAWAVRAGGAAADTGGGIATLADGSIVVTGGFSGTAAFGDVSLTSVGGSDVFVAGLDGAGGFVWATRGGGAAADAGTAIAALPDGSGVVVTGEFTGVAAFGATSFQVYPFTNAFIAKVTADGAFAWANLAGGFDGRTSAAGVATLADGSSVVTGSFQGSADFGSTSLSAAGGQFDTDAFIARVRPDGFYEGVVQVGGGEMDGGRGVATLPDGSAVVAGFFSGSAVFGDTTLTAGGDRDAFIAKLGADGSFAWATRAGGALSDTAHGVAAFADDGSVIVAGVSTGAVTFGDTTLTARGNGDVFVAKLLPDGSLPRAELPGTPTGVSATAGDGEFTLFAVSWQPPASDGGVPVIDYTIEYSSDDGETWTTVARPASAHTSASVPGLVAGTSYVFRVSAVNSVGTGSPSATAPALPPTPTTWATRGGGAGADAGSVIATLADGSSIVAGSFTGTATFGGTTLTSDSRSGFIARLDAAGGFVWAIEAGDTDALSISGISLLPDGSALVTGGLFGTATFGGTTLTGSAAGVVFAARLDTDGNFLWATRATGTDFLSVTGIAALDDGSAILTGEFSGRATFGGSSVTAIGSGNVDLFVAKLDADGAFVWATRAGGAQYDTGHDVSVLPDGSAVVSGEFTGTASFGGTTLTSAGFADVFVAKVDADGAFVWATRAGGSSFDYGYAVATLADGSAVVTGEFTGTAAFGGTTLTASGGATDTDAFIARLGADGVFAWAIRAGGGDLDSGAGVATLADGSTTATGYFTGTATFGDATLTADGDSDVFIVRLDATGAVLIATAVGGADFDAGSGIATLADGSLLVTGEFGGSAAFGGTTLVSGGAGDVFIVRLAPDGSLPE